MGSVAINPSMPSSSGTSGSSPSSSGYTPPSVSGNIWMDLLNWGTNLGTNIWNMFNKKQVQDQNQANWQAEFDYNKELNQTLMEREDTQYQRTVEDMRKAGLNPLSVNGANTNSLQAMTGGSGNSNSAQLVSNNINPLGTLQDNYYKALNAHNNTLVATATAKDLESQARHRDVESQLLESHIPENNFLRSIYESFSAEEASRYADAYKRSMFEGTDKPGLENEALRESNKNQHMQNQILQESMQAQIYSYSLKNIQLSEEIEKLKSGKKLDTAQRRKIMQETTNLQIEQKKLNQEIENIKKQADILDIEIDTKSKTKDWYIRALNNYNKRLRDYYNYPFNANLFGLKADYSAKPSY